MSNRIFFVTSNDRKFKDYSEQFKKASLTLQMHNAELYELQTVDSFKIVQHKLDQARKILPGEMVLVDDRGFNVPALHGFPGPMLKTTLETIGVDGILDLMQRYEDRSAKFVTTLGFFDGRDEHIIQSEEQGFITKQKQGDNLRGWTELLYIYGYHDFKNRSLAQLDDDEWESYMANVPEFNALSKIIEIINQ